jgi:hypothetical protein
MRKILVIACMLGLALPAAADTFTDDFENGTNHGGWHYNPGDVIETTGGNPDGWWHNSWMDNFAAIIWSEMYNADFCGDYVAAGVTRISGDFISIESYANLAYYPFTVLLKNTMGTPDDIEDDIYVYPNPELRLCPQLGAGWTHYDFDIPSDWTGPDGALPPDWMGGSYWTGGDFFPSDANWTEVLSSIDSVEFWWFHPAWFGMFTMFNVGADNITIEFTDGTVANEEASWGTVKTLYQQ